MYLPTFFPYQKIPINLDNDQYFDIRLKENFKILISGPSRCGKTFFLKNLIENLDIFSKSPPQIITLVYKVMQPIYNELGVNYLLQDCENLKERLFKIANGRSMLCIFDDMINSTNLNNISNLFLVDGRHNNLSMVFITQKLFVNNDNYREISQNSDYFIIFKNPRNMQEIRHLNTQMCPGKNELSLYYKLATLQPFSYIMINLTQECDDKVKYLSNLFNSPNEIQVYNDNEVKQLSDGNTNGRTQFYHMFYKKKTCSNPNVGMYTQNPMYNSINMIPMKMHPTSSNIQTENVPISMIPMNMHHTSVNNKTKNNPISMIPMNMHHTLGNNQTKNNPISMIPMNMHHTSANNRTKNNPISMIPMDMHHTSSNNQTENNPISMIPMNNPPTSTNNRTENVPMNIQTENIEVRNQPNEGRNIEHLSTMENQNKNVQTKKTFKDMGNQTERIRTRKTFRCQDTQTEINQAENEQMENSQVKKRGYSECDEEDIICAKKLKSDSEEKLAIEYHPYTETVEKQAIEYHPYTETVKKPAIEFNPYTTNKKIKSNYKFRYQPYMQEKIKYIPKIKLPQQKITFIPNDNNKMDHVKSLKRKNTSNENENTAKKRKIDKKLQVSFIPDEDNIIIMDQVKKNRKRKNISNENENTAKKRKIDKKLQVSFIPDEDNIIMDHIKKNRKRKNISNVNQNTAKKRKIDKKLQVLFIPDDDNIIMDRVKKNLKRKKKTIKYYQCKICSLTSKMNNKIRKHLKAKHKLNADKYITTLYL